LELLSGEDLKALASDLRVDPATHPGRETLLAALAAHPGIEETLARADRRRLEARLSKMRARGLRELGKRYRVEVRGITVKSDLVAALAGSPVAGDILMELDAQEPARAIASLVGGKGAPADLARVGDLLAKARRDFEERRFDAAVDAARDAAHLAERTTHALRRASWSYAILSAQGLLESSGLSPKEAGPAWDLLEGAKARFAEGRLEDDAVLGELLEASKAAHGRTADRLRDELAEARDVVREAANLGAGVALAEDAWTRAADLLERGDLRGARDALATAARLAADVRDRRIREIESTASAVEDHIALARKVGADVDDAEDLLAQARDALAGGKRVEAWDLLSRAERLAMQGQQEQIRKAMEIRGAQTERASLIIAASEPLVQEAEAYGLNAAEARTLLRQARDVLGKGDYVTGLLFARNAEEAALRLEPLLLEERRKRGTSKPASGLCGACGSGRLEFHDNGWGQCLACGSAFRWRAPGLTEKVRGLLGT